MLIAHGGLCRHRRRVCTESWLWKKSPLSSEKPGVILTRVRVPGAARDFSPGVSFQCRLSYGVHTAPRVQSHVSTYLRTLTILNTGSHTIVRTHENTAHTDRNGKRWSCGCLKKKKKKKNGDPNYEIMKY